MSYGRTSHRLSICLRTNGFSFSLIDSDNVLRILDDVEMDGIAEGRLTVLNGIKDCFASRGIDTFSLGKIQLVVPTRVFAWVPAKLFDSQRCKQYLTLVARPEAIEGISHIYNAAIDAYMVFSANAQILAAFKIALPGVDVHCQHSLLVNGTLLQRSASHPLMLLHVDEHRADIEAFFSGKLMLSNSFAINSGDEALYYALDVMKRLHLETPDMELALCGNVDRSYFARCQRYFPTVSLHTGLRVTHPDPAQPPVPTYRYPLLFSIDNPTI